MSATDPVVAAALAALATSVGVAGGIGGSVFLVPLLVLGGVPAGVAAPLGLLAVACGSLSSLATLWASGLVNRPLGVVGETAAGAGAAGGALLAGYVSEDVVVIALATGAFGAALAGGLRSGIRNRPDPTASADSLGEAPTGLGGTYALPEGVVRYRARRVPAGLSLLGLAGGIAGLTGTSGGYLKTPVLSEFMHIPVKVAAATTAMFSGVTAGSALLVYLVQGRADVSLAGAVMAGALIGGRAGARLQRALPPTVVRRVLSVLLLLVSAVLAWQVVS